MLYAHGLNILRNDEFVEREGNVFFMRTELAGEVSADALLAELRAALPPPGYHPAGRQAQKAHRAARDQGAPLPG